MLVFYFFIFVCLVLPYFGTQKWFACISLTVQFQSLSMVLGIFLLSYMNKCIHHPLPPKAIRLLISTSVNIFCLAELFISAEVCFSSVKDCRSGLAQWFPPCLYTSVTLVQVDRLDHCLVSPGLCQISWLCLPLKSLLLITILR